MLPSQWVPTRAATVVSVERGCQAGEASFVVLKSNGVAVPRSNHTPFKLLSVILSVVISHWHAQSDRRIPNLRQRGNRKSHSAEARAIRVTARTGPRRQAEIVLSESELADMSPKLSNLRTPDVPYNLHITDRHTVTSRISYPTLRQLHAAPTFHVCLNTVITHLDTKKMV